MVAALLVLVSLAIAARAAFARVLDRRHPVVETVARLDQRPRIHAPIRQCLQRAIENDNGKLLRCNVGDRYVVETMRKRGLNFGGEQSGHLILHALASDLWHLPAFAANC